MVLVLQFSFLLVQLQQLELVLEQKFFPLEFFFVRHLLKLFIHFEHSYDGVYGDAYACETSFFLFR